MANFIISIFQKFWKFLQNSENIDENMENMDKNMAHMEYRKHVKYGKIWEYSILEPRIVLKCYFCAKLSRRLPKNSFSCKSIPNDKPLLFFSSKFYWDNPQIFLQNGAGPVKHFAIDLVQWLRQMETSAKHNKNKGLSKLTVAVAGHMHPPLKNVTYTQSMEHLK